MGQNASSCLVTCTKVWVAVCSAVLIGFTFRLYWHDYFTLDDFNNLYWMQQWSGTTLVGSLVNPVSKEFRPVGMAFYWILLRCCDLDPLPYHAIAWLLHSINVGLMYLVLRRIVHSTYAAASGTVLFVFQDVFNDIYWSFGTIFELMSTLLFLTGLYVHVRFKPSVVRTLLVAVVFIFALKSKEMAITLPVILLLHDLLRPGERTASFDKGSVVRSVCGLLPSLAIAAWFILVGISEAKRFTPNHPYFMVFDPATVGQGYGWYLDTLFHAHFSWVLYVILAAVVLAILALRKDRQGVFFLFYTVIALFPVIPLVNHRGDFYWYLPFLGLSGLVAVTVTFIAGKSAPQLDSRVATVVGMLLFAVMSREHYFIQKRFGVQRRADVRFLDQTHRAFVQQLRALPLLPKEATLYFASVPRHFDQQTLLSATQVALRRTDVNVRLVDQFPRDAQYRLTFDGEKVVQQ